MPKKIIITADDLGIAPEINRGIIECYQNGMLSSAALLMNAPFTHEGIRLAKENPGLETGIHLSIVEGLSLRGTKSTITDELCYFDGICLIRNWKTFLLKYFSRQLNFCELREELELQIQAFLGHFGSIPFLNSTQHMHLMPKVWKIVLDLAIKYKIKAIRTPSLERPNRLWLNKRFPFLLPFEILGEMSGRDLRKNHIKLPDGALGMQFSGNISPAVLIKILKCLPDNSRYEIVMHPGYESMILRQNLPWAYSMFNWDIERQALLSNQVKDYIKANDIGLIQFSQL